MARAILLAAFVAVSLTGCEDPVSKVTKKEKAAYCRSLAAKHRAGLLTDRQKSVLQGRYQLGYVR